MGDLSAIALATEEVCFSRLFFEGTPSMSKFTGTRGRIWFKALTGQEKPMPGDPPSVLVADAPIGNENARFLCVVPDPDSRFPCARHGEVGLEQAYTLAARIREVLGRDELPTTPSLRRDSSPLVRGVLRSDPKRPIIAIVDVKSQAYGRREEIAGIHLAAAAAADAYATARFAGHPVITLIVGQAISGGFLTHGYQANRLLAFADHDVLIHAMHKEPAARITRRTVAQLESLAKTVTPLSYDVRDYAKLGLLYKLLPVSNPEAPSADEVSLVHNAIAEAIADARKGPTDLRNRFESADAQTARKASRLIRARLEEQWNR
jgi:biotin-independent malonate decarboxylase gamma subunit